MISKLFGGLLGLIGAVSTAGLGYLEYECRVNGEYCEQALFADTPETLDALLEQQQRLASQQEEISEKLDTMGVEPAMPSSGNVLDRLDKLEERVSKLEALDGGGLGDITVTSEYLETLPTQTVGQFEISIRGCTRVNTAVECAFIITNIGPNEIGINIDINDNGSADSLAFPPDGQPIIASRGTLGDLTKTNEIRRSFPVGIPAQLVLRFDNVDQNIPGFLLVQLHVFPGYGGSQKVDFRNVVIN